MVFDNREAFYDRIWWGSRVLGQAEKCSKSTIGTRTMHAMNACNESKPFEIQHG